MVSLDNGVSTLAGVSSYASLPWVATFSGLALGSTVKVLVHQQVPNSAATLFFLISNNPISLKTQKKRKAPLSTQEVYKRKHLTRGAKRTRKSL
jgi:hypothetical protein